jgi:hypothetical protein
LQQLGDLPEGKQKKKIVWGKKPKKQATHHLTQHTDFYFYFCFVLLCFACVWMQSVVVVVVVLWLGLLAWF